MSDHRAKTQTALLIASQLADVAARIRVAEKGEFLELTFDGEPLYGFRVGADDAARARLLQFGALCADVTPSALAHAKLISALQLAIPVIERVASTPCIPSKRAQQTAAITARTAIDDALQLFGIAVEAKAGPATNPTMKIRGAS